MLGGFWGRAVKSGGRRYLIDVILLESACSLFKHESMLSLSWDADGYLY